ncbi:organic solute carrier partner 1 [Haematobia irritans]|uniref:organic solute carrier partner 1 n=1 Tax=Haematobia irritans TaxID=7368 RepID=UPI003F4FE394
MSSPPDLPSLNPKANVFIIVNLGCEMLYVIDQRLKAQKIATDKSRQVLHDVTSVLLEPKFIESLIVGSSADGGQLLTEEHCKFMLKDIATCSLMRLDEVSMDKLWNLMTMIYKWQLFHTKYQYQLMDITFRHLVSIGQLYPEEKNSLLIDYTKNTLLDFWNACTDDEQNCIYATNITWLKDFRIKISLLIRLGFQAMDGTFYAHVNESYFNDFRDCIGDNIYMKSAEIAQLKRQEMTPSSHTVNSSANCVNQLADMLNYTPSTTGISASHNTSDSDDFKPINFQDFQKQFEKNLQQCNILFEDLDVNVMHRNCASSSSGNVHKDDAGEFIHLNPIYNRQSLEGMAAGQNTAPLNAETQPTTSGNQQSSNVINKDLLDLYSKLN